MKSISTLPHHPLVSLSLSLQREYKTEETKSKFSYCTSLGTEEKKNKKQLNKDC